MDRVIRFEGPHEGGVDGRDRRLARWFIEALEAAWRENRSTQVVTLDTALAYVVGPSQRGIHQRASRDVIRSLGTLQTLLDGSDVVVTANGNPAAVIISTDEYQRLTDRDVT